VPGKGSELQVQRSKSLWKLVLNFENLVFLRLFFFVLELGSGPHTCQASILPLEPHPLSSKVFKGSFLASPQVSKTFVPRKSKNLLPGWGRGWGWGWQP
jgi:hypothetical protein